MMKKEYAHLAAFGPRTRRGHRKDKRDRIDSPKRVPVG